MVAERALEGIGEAVSDVRRKGGIDPCKGTAISGTNIQNTRNCLSALRINRHDQGSYSFIIDFSTLMYEFNDDRTPSSSYRDSSYKRKPQCEP